MKKILVVLLALAMLISSVAIFASCGAKPQLDLEKAKDALEDEDYSVTHSDDADDFEETPWIEETLTAHDDDDNVIYITRYADAKSAKLAYKTMKLQRDIQVDYIKLQIKTLENQLKKYEDDLESDEID